MGNVLLCWYWRAGSRRGRREEPEVDVHRDLLRETEDVEPPVLTATIYPRRRVATLYVGRGFDEDVAGDGGAARRHGREDGGVERDAHRVAEVRPEVLALLTAPPRANSPSPSPCPWPVSLSLGQLALRDDAAHMGVLGEASIQ